MTTEKETIDVEIGTPAQALWERVKKESLTLIEQSENNLIIQREICELAKANIEKEKALNNSNT